MAKRAAALLIDNDNDISRRRNKNSSQVQKKVKSISATNATRNMKLQNLSPLNEAQRQMMVAFASGMHVVAEGSAGTGKSYVGMYLALRELFDSNVSSVKIIRSAVPGRDVGFLPGSLEDKTAVYELPYKDIVNDLLCNGTGYDIMSNHGAIDFMTTSYLRGLTFRNCVLLIDEFQNMSKIEIYSILTRVGENCRVILCGDTKQKDLPMSQSGFEYLVSLANKMPDLIDMVHFTAHDIVRSDFVKRLIMAEEGD